MTRTPHHLLRITGCLAGGLLALSVILVAAVASLVWAGGLALGGTLAPPARRLRGRLDVRRTHPRPGPAPRAEAAT